MPRRRSRPRKPSRLLRANIRQAVRDMFSQTGEVDKEAIKSRFLAEHPGQEGYIKSVVKSYGLAVQQRYGKGIKAQLEPPKAEFDQNQEPTDATKALKSETRTHLEITSTTDEDQQNDHAILQDFKDSLFIHDRDRVTPLFTPLTVPSLATQACFLDIQDQDDRVTQDPNHNDIEHAVLISSTAEAMPSQFALMGGLKSQESVIFQDPRVMLNTNVPFSAFICGVQGSGKSHTTHCIIENCSMASPILGALRQRLSTLVLNFNEYSSNISTQPCEAAFLSSVLPEWSNHGLSIPVRVLVPPSNFYNLKKVYSQIPNVEVLPFRLKTYHLNISIMLSLMSMDSSDRMPLYMSQVVRVLREMAIENHGGAFDYLDFRKRLKDLQLDRAQTPFLQQRLDLLDSYLDLNGRHNSDYFTDGGVTILDLSCPFMDQSTTCILFRIAINLFLHDHHSRGKMIVADEAHKYMNESPAAEDLTKMFLNIIRQQRHLGVRTIISTQEPTISPRLIDLCSMTIIHRFTSPEWYRTIAKHVPIGDSGSNSNAEDSLNGLYQIAGLRTGEALVFAPSAYLLDGNSSTINATHRVFKMGIRKRITWDGGRTILCIR
ncbi:hypothetical protein BDV28DRAFT_149397 [Aspergillus coremiiformis]|uniref:Zona occludens toxin N-terminal domain-containing protein n=1 Tax=Aspergillus coremiiformis TaxID=138285 RepID=A0A5N6Z4Y5_9EURO|nr:hypothetical protein BDV28DRAFT_149397 [Aspergillus coremiiformis]